MLERMVWHFIRTVQFFHYIHLKVTSSLPGLIAKPRSSIHWPSSVIFFCFFPQFKNTLLSSTAIFSHPTHTLLSGIFFFFLNSVSRMCLCVCWILSNAFPASINNIIWLFTLVCWDDGLHHLISNVEPALHPWSNSNLVMVYNSFYTLVDSVANIFLIFASKFMRDLGL